MENLRWLCPNCHTQTITYGSKKIKRTKELSKKEKSTKINWPSVEWIISELQTRTYLNIAKELKISDNAIRKYIRRHNIEPPKVKLKPLSATG